MSTINSKNEFPTTTKLNIFINVIGISLNDLINTIFYNPRYHFPPSTAKIQNINQTTYNSDLKQ